MDIRDPGDLVERVVLAGRALKLAPAVLAALEEVAKAGAQQLATDRSRSRQEALAEASTNAEMLVGAFAALDLALRLERLDRGFGTGIEIRRGVDLGWQYARDPEALAFLLRPAGAGLRLGAFGERLSGFIGTLCPGLWPFC